MLRIGNPETNNTTSKFPQMMNTSGVGVNIPQMQAFQQAQEPEKLEDYDPKKDSVLAERMAEATKNLIGGNTPNAAPITVGQTAEQKQTGRCMHVYTGRYSGPALRMVPTQFAPGHPGEFVAECAICHRTFYIPATEDVAKMKESIDNARGMTAVATGYLASMFGGDERSKGAAGILNQTADALENLYEIIGSAANGVANKKGLLTPQQNAFQSVAPTTGFTGNATEIWNAYATGGSVQPSGNPMYATPDEHKPQFDMLSGGNRMNI